MTPTEVNVVAVVLIALIALMWIGLALEYGLVRRKGERPAPGDARARDDAEG